uniref:Protein FAM163A n=1 Tax=Geotrypetes seraphini TaxID=260995 RepID=A0A6P8NKQ9_GEOSA|nr:protein FAM163A [Geotrypetes seraphini]XP_033771170.1 protein FAM163A [Geotrypetes seraphini]XP_033771171.1 protein FAM163A [Geotrypetes seraphini]XP_033771172.1 protein FAM163A [Geotrypetes seraphini]
MTAGAVVITGGILATVILLCIIAVLCYCRLQYYCCKKDETNGEEEEEEEESGLPPLCNSCASYDMDRQSGPAPVACASYNSPFYIHTTDMVRNGGERITYTPTWYKDMGTPLSMGVLQNHPVSWQGGARETFTNPRAISTEV